MIDPAMICKLQTCIIFNHKLRYAKLAVVGQLKSLMPRHDTQADSHGYLVVFLFATLRVTIVCWENVF